MILLSTPRSASSGVSIEMTCRGRNKRVSIRGWHTDVVTIPPLYLTLEELAAHLGLIVPEQKKAAARKSRI